MTPAWKGTGQVSLLCILQQKKIHGWDTEDEEVGHWDVVWTGEMSSGNTGGVTAAGTATASAPIHGRIPTSGMLHSK